MFLVPGLTGAFMVVFTLLDRDPYGTTFNVLAGLGMMAFGPLCLGLLGLLRPYALRKWERRHGELAAIIDGKAEAGRFLGAFSLVGTYGGMPVEYRVLTSQDVTNPYDAHVRMLTMATGAGGKDWMLLYGSKKRTLSEMLLDVADLEHLGAHSRSWHVRTEDEALERRLLDWGVIERVQKLAAQRPPLVAYKAKEGSLSCATPIRSGEFNHPASPDRFKAWLALLADLAEVNKRVNVG